MKWTLPIESGIYVIINNINQKKYVGYALNIKKRCTGHHTRLNNKQHVNSHLQAAWNKYGEYAFSFEVLQLCDIEKLCLYEHIWATILKVHNKEFGYNILPTDPNSKSPKRSQETKQKQSKARKGIVFSEETLLRMSKAALGRINTQNQKDIASKTFSKPIIVTDLQDIFLYEFKSIKEAVEILHISRFSIQTVLRDNIKKKKDFYKNFKFKYK